MALLLSQSRSMMVSRAASPRVVAFSCVRSPLVPTRAAPMVSRPQTISSGSAFMGGSSFGGSSMIRVAPVGRGALQVVANAKKSLGCTKEGTNRKAANTSGFRARMATHNGRKILKKRRAKGRHVLCRISMSSAQGKK